MPLSFVQPAAPVLNCPVVVYERREGPSTGPEVRGHADVSFTITKSENVLLDVDQKTVDCQGRTISEQIVTQPFRRYELSLQGVEIGDELMIDDVFLAPMIGGACPLVTAPIAVETLPSPGCGTAPTPLPPSTGGGIDWGDSDATTDENLSPYGDGMGCNAGGAGSLIVALALLGVRRRRR